MLNRSRAPGKCIFCALKASTPSTTSSTSRRSVSRTTSRIRPRTKRRDQQGDHKVYATERRRDGSFAGGTRPKKGDNAVSSDLGPHDRATKTFRPGDGESFGRTAPLAPRRDRQQAEKQKLAIRLRVAALEERLHEDAALQKLDLDHDALEAQFGRFKQHLFQDQADEVPTDASIALLNKLMSLSAQENSASVDLHLKYAFYGFVASSKFSATELQNQERLLDFRHPAEWFPRARQLQRQVHVHVGPTNSGKTYHALKRLEQAESGCYAGPLRLLAHEVFERLNANRQVCNLVTGDERREVDLDPNQKTGKVACTVEMVSLKEYVDVIVIDEIQMLGSEDRGWAWTQAFLGAFAKEVHVCGEERTVNVIRELAAACGDTVHVHKYERLSPLEMMPKSLGGNLRNLKKGDCIVGFSVMVLHSLKSLIEQTTKKKCAIIYGTLPPETRAQQAKLFNDPDNDYDYLVASNAVGMGLNLSIRRLIFQSAYHNIGGKLQVLAPADIKQIAGRAGRYSTAAADMKKAKISVALGEARADAAPPAIDTKKRLPGLVTSLEELDYPVIERAMDFESEPIQTAGIFPPSLIVEHFARYFPARTPFSYLLLQIREKARLSSRSHLCLFKGNIATADALESVDGLRLKDLYVFTLAPFNMKRKSEPELARAYARLVVGNKGATVLEIDELEMELLEEGVTLDQPYLRKLEELHKGIITFMWLSYKFPQIFLDREQALFVKSLVEQRIEKTLSTMVHDYDKARRARDQAIMDLLKPKDDAGQDSECDGHDGAVSVEGGVRDENAATPRTVDVDVTMPGNGDPAIEDVQLGGEAHGPRVEARQSVAVS